MNSDSNSSVQSIETRLETSFDDQPTPAQSKGWPSLPKLLRWLGAITLLSSALTFLVSEWMHTDQVLRYGYFLGFTVLLSACGWFCITRWKDDKGARTFFALGAAILPAHFAQLGAMLFAKRDGQLEFAGFRRAFEFAPPSWPELGWTLGVALAVLIPLTFLGFAAMARKQARSLTLIYLLGNATLLLTVRDPNLVALIGFFLLGGLVWADRRFFAPQSRMRTWDGVAMRTLLFAPFVLLVGRNLVLHPEQSDLLYSLLCATFSCLLYLGLPRLRQATPLAYASRTFALAPAFAAWYFLIESFGVSGAYWLPLVVLPCSLIAGLLSYGLGPAQREIRGFSATAAILTALWQLITVETPASSLLAVMTSLVVILVGYGMRERWIFRIGLLGMGMGLLYHLRYAIELYQSEWLWVSLAATGVLVLLGSSYLERYGRQGFSAIKALHIKVSGWK